jgi:4-phospho-D-threonate 3-dehydrogenase / 4-phospho-D-erythronate 3-dehydrogenase
MNNENQKCILGITMGDPAGSGPEIVVKALAFQEMYDISRPLVIGDAAAMQAAADICGWKGQVRAVADADVAETGRQFGVIDVLDLKNVDLARLVRGRVDPMAGKAAYDYIVKGTQLALDGQTGAIVTSAINKDSLNKAGYHYDGHTELLAYLCGVKNVTMMLTGGGLRVTHVSTHCSLREAIERVKRERVLTVIKLTQAAMLQIGIEKPRIAVAGLNPHAGEGGLFGREEIDEIEPAIQDALALGYDVSGPIPADTVFFRMLNGAYDVVVVMYHDQGHIPLKSHGFYEGVNVTLGLPIIRTSVDHGTNFGKAGKGTANPQSLIEAIRFAALMCKSKQS